MLDEPPKPKRFLALRPVHLTAEQMAEIQVTGALPVEAMIESANEVDRIWAYQHRMLHAALTNLDKSKIQSVLQENPVLAAVIRLAEVIVGLQEEKESDIKL